VVVEHLAGAAVLAVGVEEVGFSALDGGDFLGVGGRGIVGTNAELSAHLADETALAVNFKLQLLRVENDQWLIFFYGVADVGKDVGDASFDLRAEDALFEGEEGADRLDAALGDFFGDGIEVHRRGVGGVAEDAGRVGLGAGAGEGCKENGSAQKALADTCRGVSFEQVRAHNTSNSRLAIRRTPSLPVSAATAGTTYRIMP
jgi:hypothetical protein